MGPHPLPRDPSNPLVPAPKWSSGERTGCILVIPLEMEFRGEGEPWPKHPIFTFSPSSAASSEAVGQGSSSICTKNNYRYYAQQSSQHFTPCFLTPVTNLGVRTCYSSFEGDLERWLWYKSSDLNTFVHILLLGVEGKVESKAALGENSKVEGTHIYLAFERK